MKNLNLSKICGLFLVSMFFWKIVIKNWERFKHHLMWIFKNLSKYFSILASFSTIAFQCLHSPIADQWHFPLWDNFAFWTFRDFSKFWNYRHDFIFHNDTAKNRSGNRLLFFEIWEGAISTPLSQSESSKTVWQRSGSWSSGRRSYWSPPSAKI